MLWTDGPARARHPLPRRSPGLNTSLNLLGQNRYRPASGLTRVGRSVWHCKSVGQPTSASGQSRRLSDVGCLRLAHLPLAWLQREGLGFHDYRFLPWALCWRRERNARKIHRAVPVGSPSPRSYTPDGQSIAGDAATLVRVVGPLPTSMYQCRTRFRRCSRCRTMPRIALAGLVGLSRDRRFSFLVLTAPVVAPPLAVAMRLSCWKPFADRGVRHHAFITRLRRRPMRSTSSSITSPGLMKRRCSRPQPLPTVPEPRNSPG